MERGAKVFVTGGSGFVGNALCRRLRELGCDVTSFSRRDVPNLRALGVKVQTGDLTDPAAPIATYLEGSAAVFHTAAKVEMWGRREDFVAVNVNGTERLLKAAQNAGVPKFIFTSSPSVIADGTNLEGVDETYPYPNHHKAYYPETKAIAERLVRAANRSGFNTVSLRPHLIFGPGDTNLIPAVIEKAKAGRLVQVGKGLNRVDVTYIADCVEAHINAWTALGERPDLGSNAYFISQGEPVKLWEWINQVLNYSALPAVTRSVPVAVAASLATLLESVCKLIPHSPEPPLTRFLVSEMATSHFFSIEKAKRELNYRPSLSVAEALEKTFGVPRTETAGSEISGLAEGMQ